MADEKNQGSQQAPRKKKSKRERERKKKRKKERKKRKKERKEGRKKERRARNGDNKDDKYGNRQWTRSIRWASCAPEAPRENNSNEERSVKTSWEQAERRAQKQMGHKESPFLEATKTKNTEQWINKGDKHRNRWKTRRTFASQTYPEKRIAIDREVRKQVWDNKGNEHGNKWETKRRRVSCAQKHPGRRTVTGMDKRNGERRTATQMKDSGMFIAPKHLEVLKPRHTWETRRILGPKST